MEKIDSKRERLKRIDEDLQKLIVLASDAGAGVRCVNVMKRFYEKFQGEFRPEIEKLCVKRELSKM